MGEGGVSGDVARLHLEDGTTLVAKRPALDPVVRDRQRALGMYEREARFYRDLAPLMPVRTPRCVFASADLLLLEDIAPAVAGTFREGLVPEQVDAVVADFVALHGPWQGAASLDDMPWLWRVSPDEGDRWQHNLEQRLPRFLDRHRAQLTATQVVMAEAVTARIGALMLAAASLPATLCHGDPGPPNLMFGHPSGEVVYVDWQLAAARSGALDLAWLLVLGVPVALREARGDEWLRGYGERLGLDRGELRHAFDLGVALALRAPIWMGGAPDAERSPHVDAYAGATIPRAFAAAVSIDLSSIEGTGDG